MQSVFRAAFSRIEEGGIVVASTPLLRSVLAQQFAQEKLALGVQTWQRPAILTPETWLASCWQEARLAGADVPVLLSPVQETLLWESVIAEQNPGLLDLRATARLARQAAAHIANWHIPLKHEAWTEHVDGTQFLAWRAEFARRLREKKWTTRAALWRSVPEYLNRGWVSKCPVAFAGFETISPALDRLRGSVEHNVFGPGDLVADAKAACYILENEQAELDLAARWARARFEAYPAQTVAVFVPDLAPKRSEVTRAFDRIFYPSRAPRFEFPAPGDLAFHVAVQQPLFDEPLISSALLLLELPEPRIRQSSATSILRSPAIAGAAVERSARAEADLRLRKQRQLDVSLPDLIWAARDCPALLAALRAAETLIAARPAEQTPAEWSRFFSAVLKALGWPGDAPLATHEADLIDRWKDILSELASLNLVRSKIGFEDALVQLKRIANGAAGSDVGSWFSPVQILDAQDALGLRFDAALITGMSETTWPPALPLSPLIPLRLQAQAGVPGATSATLHAERVKLSASLFACAPNVVATCIDRISPIVRPFVEPATEELQRWGAPSAIESILPANLDTVDDTDAPAFLVNGAARGGTSLIKAQANCPFRAWAEIRLRAQTPEDAAFGFDALERGTFLHAALHFVWNELQSQSTLKSMPESDLRNLVARAVEQAVATRKNDSFFVQVRAAEKDRLCQLIFDWLTNIERERLIPFTVENLEHKREFNLAGLPLSVRIDRVDRLVNGGLVLIDYKSGKKDKKDLDCERPREPQLLVYAAALGHEVEGVFFGQLKPRELELVGNSLAVHIKRKKARPDWDDYMEQACSAVESLAQEFLAGKAAVNPAKGACDYCTSVALCRKNESAASQDNCE